MLSDVLELILCVRRNLFLKSPKHQSGANLAWPAIFKIEGHTVMKTHHVSPSQEPQHELVFVLSRAVVKVQLYMFLPEPVMGEVNGADRR